MPEQAGTFLTVYMAKKVRVFIRPVYWTKKTSTLVTILNSGKRQ